MDRLQRLLEHARTHTSTVAALVGVLLAAIGALIGLTNFWGVLLLGIGSALIAASAYAMLTRLEDRFAERLREQGLIDFFPSRLRHFDDDYWPNLMSSAQHHYKVLGVANHGYMGREAAKTATRDAITSAVRRDVHVEFLWLDPDSGFAHARDDEEERTTRRDTVDSLAWFWDLRHTLLENEQRLLSLYTYDAVIPSCGLTWADDQLVVAHYIAGQNNLDAPGMILSTAITLPRLGQLAHALGIHHGRAETAKAYMDTYAEAKGRATPLNADRVQAIVAKRGDYSGGQSEEDLRARLEQQGLRSKPDA